MQGSARKDVVFGAARVYTFTVPGPKWKSWLEPLERLSWAAQRRGLTGTGGRAIEAQTRREHHRSNNATCNHGEVKKFIPDSAT